MLHTHLSAHAHTHILSFNHTNTLRSDVQSMHFHTHWHEYFMSAEEPPFLILLDFKETELVCVKQKQGNSIISVFLLLHVSIRFLLFT